MNTYTQPAQWHVDVRKMCDWLKPRGLVMVVKFNGDVILKTREPKRSKLTGELR
jgi:hypothetical protein